MPEVGDVDRGRLIRCEELFEDFCVVTASVRQGIAVNVAIKQPEPVGMAAPPPATAAVGVDRQDDQC